MKSILIIMISIVSVMASQIDVIWEKKGLYLNNAVVSDDPLKSVQNEIVKEVNRYLKPRTVIDVTEAIPKPVEPPIPPTEVREPKVVKTIALKQGNYESKRDFEKRKLEAKQLNDAKIARRQQNYLNRVHQRNEKITRLEKAFQEEVAKRNAIKSHLQALVEQDLLEIKKEQKLKLIRLKKIVPIVAKNAFKKYLADPYISQSNYFVNSETIQMTLTSSMGGYSENIEFEVSPKVAQKMEQDITKVMPKIYFSIDVKEDKNAFVMSRNRTEIHFDDTIYVAKASQKNREKKFLTASLEFDNGIKKPIYNAKLELQSDDLEFKTQKSEVKAIRYTISSGNNNDILERLKMVKPSTLDDKKWLFVVGIEDYENSVDSVVYSKESAETFAKVTQKLLGIPQENSFVLTNSKTTSGSIKSQLKFMLEQVKKGDTIYFYYSGHGIPVPSQSNEPYILPSDISLRYIEDEKFFRLKNIYSRLSHSKASKVIAVMDSCFSGATDGRSLYKGVAATRLIPKKVDSFDKKKMVVLSAGGKRQFSNMYEKKHQRLFSYFVMDALLKNKKTVSQIYANVTPMVEKESRKIGRTFLQQPTLDGNENLNF
jgi:hypothetical protein